MYRYKIFVSYSHSNLEFAQNVVDMLHQRAPFLDVWIDFEGIRPTDRWHDRILDALADRQLLILIISPTALRSSYVVEEYKSFLDSSRPILPLYYRKATLPDSLSAIQYVDCRMYRARIPSTWNKLSAEILCHVWHKRFEWINSHFIPLLPTKRLAHAQALLTTGEPVCPQDPQALSILEHWFKIMVQELKDDTLAQWYIYLMCQSSDPSAEETLKRLQQLYGTAEHPLLRQSFEECLILRG